MKRNAFALLAASLAFTGASADTIAPPPPANVALAFKSCGAVTIQWDPVIDEFGSTPPSGLKQYILYRRRPGFPDVVLNDTRGVPPDRLLHRREYTQTVSVWPEANVTVGVQAVDNAGNASAISFASVARPQPTSPLCQDTAAPAKPTLTVESLGCRGALVRAQGGGSGVAGYQYFRDLTRFSGTPGMPLGQADDVIGPIPGQTYGYRVRTVDAAGNVSSHHSDTVMHAVPQCGPPSSPVPSVAVIAGYLPGSSLQHSMSALRSVVFGDHSSQTKTINLYDYLAEISNGRIFPVPSLGHDAGPLALPGQPQDYGCTLQQPSGNWQGCSAQLIESELLRLAGWTGGEAARWVFFVGGISDVGKSGGNRVLIGANRPADQLAKTLAHEFLHGYGLGHSAARVLCPGYGRPSPDNSGAGALGPVQSDPTFGCQYYEYGDGYSVMGGVDLYHPPVFMKQLLGTLQPQETRLAINEDLGVYLGSVTGSNYPLRQLLLKRTIGAQTAWYSMEFRTPDGFNGPLSGGSNVAPFHGLQIREILQKAGSAAQAQTVLTATIPLVPNGQRAYYDPVSRFGVILGGYGGMDGALVTLCGMHNECPGWVLEASPWAAN